MVQARLSFPEALACVAWNLCGALFRDDGGQAVSFGRHGGKLGRPPKLGIPVEIREAICWGKRVKASPVSRKGEEAAVVQMEFPLEYLPAYFPDPRQECFMVRHD